MLYSGWEETMLRRLGIKERNNPFKIIRILLKIIDNLMRKNNGKEIRK